MRSVTFKVRVLFFSYAFYYKIAKKYENNWKLFDQENG